MRAELPFGRGEQLRGSYLVKFRVQGPFHHGRFVLGFLLYVGLQVSDSRSRKGGETSICVSAETEISAEFQWKSPVNAEEGDNK